MQKSEILNDVFKRLNSLKKTNNIQIANVDEIQNLFDFINKYIFNNIGIDLYLFELKPSEILRAFINDEHQKLAKIRIVLIKFLNVYDVILENLMWLIAVVSDFINPNFNI